MKTWLPLVAVALAGAVPTQAPARATPTREHFAPAGYESAYHDWHYTPVLKVGDQVIVSGIPAAGPGSYEDKVRRMFDELRKQLELAGASLADVVELTSFHSRPTDSKSVIEEFKRFTPIHREFFRSHYPAWSAVGTSALLAPDAVVELRAVAMIGSGRAPKADIPLPKPPSNAKPAG
jgi:enamine deaminase RidA (YjgF/YER057c/UK114 family)